MKLRTDVYTLHFSMWMLDSRVIETELRMKRFAEELDEEVGCEQEGEAEVVQCVAALGEALERGVEAGEASFVARRCDGLAAAFTGGHVHCCHMREPRRGRRVNVVGGIGVAAWGDGARTLTSDDLPRCSSRLSSSTYNTLFLTVTFY